MTCSQCFFFPRLEKFKGKDTRCGTGRVTVEATPPWGPPTAVDYRYKVTSSAISHGHWRGLGRDATGSAARVPTPKPLQPGNKALTASHSHNLIDIILVTKRATSILKFEGGGIGLCFMIRIAPHSSIKV